MHITVSTSAATTLAPDLAVPDEPGAELVDVLEELNKMVSISYVAALHDLLRSWSDMDFPVA